MTVEIFSKKVMQSNIVNTYVATAFFATLIFFVINANVYTSLEMVTAVMIVTIAFKGIANVMVSLVILLFPFDNKKAEMAFEESSLKVDGLLNDLAVQQTKIKSKDFLKKG